MVKIVTSMIFSWDRDSIILYRIRVRMLCRYRTEKPDEEFFREGCGCT